jgi:hypothetical protein
VPKYHILAKHRASLHFIDEIALCVPLSRWYRQFLSEMPLEAERILHASQAALRRKFQSRKLAGQPKKGHKEFIERISNRCLALLTKSRACHPSLEKILLNLTKLFLPK